MRTEAWSVVRFAFVLAGTVLLVGCGRGTGARRAPGGTIQLTQDGTYRRIYAGPVPDSVLAEKEPLNVLTGAVELDYLVLGSKSAVLSRAAETLAVEVAPGDRNIDDRPDPTTWPETALFLDQPDTHRAGTLEFVDLSPKGGWKPVAVPGGVGVVADGFWYGAKGDEILFASNFDAPHETGDLHWSNGTRSSEVVPGVSPRAVLFSADRSVALVGAVDGTACDSQGSCTHDASVPSPIGPLVAVDMKTGLATKIASEVRLFNPCTSLDFALSANGKVAAYVTQDGKVMLVPTSGGAPTLVAPASSAPAVSFDGTEAAYFSGNDSHVWSNGTSTLRMPGTGCGQAVFSPDGRWLAVFEGISLNGGVVYDTATEVAASGSSDPIPVGSDVEGLWFYPSDPTQETAELVAVVDATSMNGRPLYNGAGNLLIGPPGVEPALMATRLRSWDVQVLDDGQVAYIGSDGPGITGGTAFVTQPGAAPPLELGTYASPGSLAVWHTIPEIDAMIWMVPVGAPDAAKASLIDRQYPDGVLWGSTSKGPAKVMPHAQSNVIDAVIARDGGVLVLVATDKDHPAADAGIWELPAPK